MKRFFQFLDKGCPRPAAFSGFHSYGKPFWQQSRTSPSITTQGIERIPSSFALSATTDLVISAIATSSAGPARRLTRSIASKHTGHPAIKTSIFRLFFINKSLALTHPLVFIFCLYLFTCNLLRMVIAGWEVFFCRCPYCPEEFQKDPDQYVKRLQGEIPYDGVFGLEL